MKRVKRLAFAFADGLGAVAMVFAPPHFKRMPVSDLDRMRGDVARVGDTMRHVMTREHGQQSPGSASATVQ